MPKRTISNDRRDILSIAAARLASLGSSQTDIATTLDLSQATVSRFIKHADKQGWLENRHPRFREDRVDAPLMAAVQAEFFSDAELVSRLKPAKPQDFVLDVHSYGADVFHSAAAQQVVNLLARSRNVGVMWGRTLTELVRHMEKPIGQMDAGVRARIHCVPLCGDPVFMLNLKRQQYSASRLAETLEELCTGQSNGSALPSLSGVPAYIGRYPIDTAAGSKGRSRTRRRQLFDFVESIPGYRSIFGSRDGTDDGRPPKVAQVDTILTGVGIVTAEGDEEELGLFVQERLKQEMDLTRAELADHAWGDMGGLLLGKRTNGKEHPSVAALNEGWIGVTPKTFSDLASKAKPDGSPGVIIIANGAGRARMVFEASRRGLANHIIVDSELAAAIKELPAEDE